MAIDARIPLAGIPVQPPRFDLGETYAQVARIKALDEQRRGSELYRQEAERSIARDDAWRATMAQVLAPPQTPQQGPPSPPQGLTAPSTLPPYAGPSMADAVPPASPQQGQYGLTAPPQPLGMPPRLDRAPSPMQPAGLWAPPAPPGPPGGGPPPVGLGPGAQGPPPPANGLAAAAPTKPASQFASLVQPLNMEALQQAYALDPEKTAQWHSRHVQLQGQKLAQVKQSMSTMYQVGKRILTSDNPQRAYEVGIAQLKAQGIPLPADLPPTYDPAWMAYTVDSLRTAETDLADVQAKQAQAELELKQYTAMTERGKMQNEARKLGQAAPITGDKELDAALVATHPEGIPPGGLSAAIQKAHQYMQDRRVDEDLRKDEGKQAGRLEVSKATGENAARLERSEKPLEGEAAKAVSDLTTLRTMTDDLAALYKPEYSGPITGRTGYLREQAGRMDEQETAFRRTAGDIADILARLRTGAAFPASEQTRLERLAPGPNDRPEAFQSKLQSFQRALEQMRESRLRTGTTGREQLRQETTPTTPLVGSARPRPVSEMTLEERMAERDALRRKR